MMPQELESRAAELWAPISEDAPCGEDCRYDDEFDAVDRELKKLSSVEGLQPDWTLVLRQSSSLLRERTKDMTLLSALCVALLQQERYAGLAVGLAAFDNVVRNHWAAMFPPVKRLRGRAGDYTWLVQQLTRVVGEMPPEDAEHTALEACLERFDQLDGFLREQWADLHPAVGPLRRALVAYLEQTQAAPAAPAEGGNGASVAEPESGAADRTPAGGATGAGPAAEAARTVSLVPGSIQSEDQARRVVEQATRALKMASQFYKKQAAALEEEKQRIEESLRQAEKVIEMQRSVYEMLGLEDDGSEEK